MGRSSAWGRFNDITCEVLGLRMLVKHLKRISSRRADVTEVVAPWTAATGSSRTS